MTISVSWSVAIFAHNEANNIVACLDSVLSQDAECQGQVFVLVNGSHDATERLAANYATAHPNVTVVTLSLADKANAWNHYVHVLNPDVEVHFFIDGDTLAAPNSFFALSKALRDFPEANATGALPTTGRDRIGWSSRMVAFGRLAGCLYALRGDFVSDLRRQGIRIPVGLIGEDLFLSCLVKGLLTRRGLLQSSPRLVFSAEAGFAFRPLSPSRPGDWITYGKRLVRYQIRDYQLAMLLHYLESQPQSELPPDMTTLYRRAARLPGYRWRGRITPFDMLAVRHIRKAARRSIASSLDVPD